MNVFEQYSIEEASKLIDMPEQTLRAALQQGLFPFGVAIKLENYTYYIFKERLHAYLEARDLKK